MLDKLFKFIKKYIFRIEEDSNPNISQHLLRVTVLRGRRIRFEYDLLLKKSLSRIEALSRYWWRQTIKGLRIELNLPREERLPVSSNDGVYLIGDCHFDHKNIIKHVNRPFHNVTEMNEEIKNNWNKIVGEDDRVFFLGDYTGPPSREARQYRNKLKCWTRLLNGNKVSFLGNHDRIYGCVEFEKARILHAGGHSFLLIHDPTDEKVKTNHGKYDWLIHGHKHNNNMKDYPFINGERKTINVSVEVINYRPVSLSFLLSSKLDLDSIKRMRTIDSEPERW